jgi:methionine-rich copper-binding protein CopC
MKRLLAAARGLLAASLVASPGIAHPKLNCVNAAVQGAVASAPTEIRLTFSEDVIAKFSSVAVKDQNGNTIATGKASTDPKNEAQLVVPLKAPLPAGTYTVEWQVVSADTHRVKGTSSLTVGR